MLFNNARVKEAKVHKSNKDKLYIRCVTNMNKAEGGCMHHITAKSVSMGWVITSKNLTHSCNDSEGGRKRNYRAASLEGAYPAIGHFVPTVKASAKQLSEIARVTSGKPQYRRQQKGWGSREADWTILRVGVVL
jgi:hypothetical protein